MELKIHEIPTGNIAELSSVATPFSNTDDFLDLIGNASYLNAHSIIINETQLVPQFFDLKTQIAGDILQKFSTYGLKLAIIGDFSEVASKSLRDFIRESNRVGRIFFVESKEAAFERFGNS